MSVRTSRRRGVSIRSMSLKTIVPSARDLVRRDVRILGHRAGGVRQFSDDDRRVIWRVVGAGDCDGHVLGDRSRRGRPIP